MKKKKKKKKKRLKDLENLEDSMLSPSLRRLLSIQTPQGEVTLRLTHFSPLSSFLLSLDKMTNF